MFTFSGFFLSNKIGIIRRFNLERVYWSTKIEQNWTATTQWQPRRRQAAMTMPTMIMSLTELVKIIGEIVQCTSCIQMCVGRNEAIQACKCLLAHISYSRKRRVPLYSICVWVPLQLYNLLVIRRPNTIENHSVALCNYRVGFIDWTYQSTEA